MKNKWCLKVILFASLLFFGGFVQTDVAQAQFKKYETKTKFNPKKSKVDKRNKVDLVKKVAAADSNMATPSKNKKVSVKSLIAKKRSNKKSAFSRSRNATSGSTSKNDFFGRKTKTPPKGSDKYVNLNPETAFGPEVVTSFDFPNISIKNLTMHMQKITGINLIIEDKSISGKISIISPSPITVGDAWKAYLTALNINGLSMQKSGAFYKIVKARDLRYSAPPIYTGAYTPDTENYVMQIIPIKYISADEVQRTFRNFTSRYGTIKALQQTNTIIVQDTGVHINRLVRLIKFVDVPGHDETLQIIQVKHSSAQEIVSLLEKILSSGKTSAKFRRGSRSARGKTDAGGISKLTAEPRTNSIIAMANADGAKQLRELIQKLDVKLISSGSGKIHVYYLNYGDAETLAKTLSSLVSDAAPKGSKSSRFSRTTSSTQTLFTAPVKITADKSNNALVVTASPTDYLTIKEVIKRLDIAKDQVYLEGLIMETQITKERGFGISIIGAYGTGSAQKAGFTGGSSDLMSVLTNQVTNLGGLFVGGGIGKKIVQTGPDGNEMSINTVNGLITAIATDNNTNVLATPQLLATDNTDAVFEVGEEIPITEATQTQTGTQYSNKTQKVTLELKFTPQINKVTRFIKLKIDQKIKDFSQRKLPEGLQDKGVAVTTRNVNTVVIVRDKDTVAMGGLMRDRETDTEAKVPLLGDIPVLGWLFKRKSKNVSKVNLLFFLTPRILSPYEKTTASTMKDVLNRRNAHLKDVIGEDDPFESTVKGLYHKAKNQESGPLYDKELEREGEATIDRYNNEQAHLDVPNYKRIMQRVKEIQSGIKK